MKVRESIKKDFLEKNKYYLGTIHMESFIKYGLYMYYISYLNKIGEGMTYNRINAGVKLIFWLTTFTIIDFFPLLMFGEMGTMFLDSFDTSIILSSVWILILYGGFMVYWLRSKSRISKREYEKMMAQVQVPTDKWGR